MAQWTAVGRLFTNLHKHTQKNFSTTIGIQFSSDPSDLIEIPCSSRNNPCTAIHTARPTTTPYTSTQTPLQLPTPKIDSWGTVQMSRLVHGKLFVIPP